MNEVSRDELARYAISLGLTLSDPELTGYQSLLSDVVGAVTTFEALPPLDMRGQPGPRDPGYAPTADEDPLNAVLRRISVRKEGRSGSLSGRRIGLKDSIALAGIPMTAGSLLLEGYIPKRDSIVAERLLDAGAEIVAKLNMDSLAWASSGDTGDFGPVRNPVDHRYLASGSSGGSAAALSYDWVDMTLGADQAGSVRMPASWCGVLGLKPTHALIPYTGIMSVDPTIDHVGPLTTTVADLALILEVLAGRDETDSRQALTPKPQDYRRIVHEASTDLRGLRIAMVSEGFDAALGINPSAANAIRVVADRLAELGAQVEEVSVPEHVQGAAVGFAFYCEAQLAAFESGGNFYGRDGLYDETLPMALGPALRDRADELPATVKTVLLAGLATRARYHGAMYARAQNMRAKLRAGYDAALGRYDTLLMPTTAMEPFAVEFEGDLATTVRRSWSPLVNTITSDVTGHPSLSMPAAEVNGLPLGAMLVGRRFDDASLLAIAATYERTYGWFPAR